jgi:dihydroflavonol-4-reductase
MGTSPRAPKPRNIGLQKKKSSFNILLTAGQGAMPAQRAGLHVMGAAVSEGPLKVLVTGATGFVGSHTTRALLDAGHRVRAFIRSPKKVRRVLGEREGLELAQGDISDAASVREALCGCNGVVHTAAVVAVGTAGAPEALMKANVSGVRNVIGAAIEQNIERIVHVSSLATLFRGDGRPLSEASEPADSKHPYGRSKVLAERYVREKQEEGHPVKIVYPPAIIGPDDPGLSEPLGALRTFVQDFVPLTTAGIQYVDVRDLARAHVRIIEAKTGPDRFIVAGGFLPWPDLARSLEAATGKELRKIRVPGPVLRASGRLLELARKVVDVDLPLTSESAAYVTRWDPVASSAVLEEMGVTFRDVHESIADTVRWMRDAGHLPA